MINETCGFQNVDTFLWNCDSFVGKGQTDLYFLLGNLAHVASFYLRIEVLTNTSE